MFDESLYFENAECDADRVEGLWFAQGVRDFPPPALAHGIESVDDLPFAFGEGIGRGHGTGYLKEFFQLVSLGAGFAVNTAACRRIVPVEPIQMEMGSLPPAVSYTGGSACHTEGYPIRQGSL